MKENIVLINCDSTEELIRELSLRYNLIYIEDVEEISYNVELVVIDIDKTTESNLQRYISVMNDKKIAVMLVSKDKIDDTELILNECVIDVIKYKYKVEFCLKKIKNYLKLLKGSYGIFDEKIKKIRHIQSVLLGSMVGLVECRDITTGGHIKRTAEYMELLVNALIEEGVYADYLNGETAIELIIGAPLHDVGKLGIDDSTLRKTTKLDDFEFEVMKKHVTLGAETIDKIIKEVGDVDFLIKAREMAATHHENWDGTGYPNGLAGEEIPICGRIMSLVDVYDAITSVRSYKKGLSHEDAVKIMSTSMKSKFDPKILEVFLKHNEIFKKI